MPLPQVIVLNGSSSSGKTAVAKLLQEMLPQQYLNFSIDIVLYSLPASDLRKMQTGAEITRPGYDWPSLVRGYHYCLPALLQAGCHLLIDHAWCERGEKRELLTELAGYSVALVGVYCNSEVAMAREQARQDRAIGLVAWQSARVHQDMQYDLNIDTTGISPQVAAEKLCSDILKHGAWTGAIETLEHLNMLN
ncbi:chloramphenicol phosphotransferase CPT family protein [Deefgea piscis]|uniref:chloramphenicol phosphotransferase CPT family protein n=1 Tax=Deefgea piscis TaxID=2739061 RepID=UPI001C7F5F58|nr:AAA family ATPase [Deefgea piscis]QZA81396.1 zeta toxin family protein [Deefgea piscis]